VQTYFVEAVKEDERFDAAVDELPGVRTRSTLCVPLPAAPSDGHGGDGGSKAPPVGVLQLTNKTRRRPLVAFDKELADLLACNLASCVHHIARASTAATAAAASLHARHADAS
jgi:GAF domain-containing protein